MDIRVARLIAASPDEVARVMFDPANDPRWIGGAKSVEPAGPPAVGARVRRYGGFLGRKFSWVTEVTALEPGRRLELAFVEGPMKGGVTYEIAPAEAGSTVSIRNHGGSDMPVPGIGWMLRRSVAKDLERLAALVER
jgi:uncharacterized protein YndB with AHSA1/START domain